MTSKTLWQRGPVTIGLALAFCVSAWALLEFDAQRDIPLKVTIEPSPVPSAGQGMLKILLDLPSHIHITSRENGFFFITPDSGGLLSWGLPSFPAGETLEDATVYRGKVAVVLPFNVPADLETGAQMNVAGTVGYQVCTEVDPVYCAPPVERRFSASFTIGQNRPSDRAKGDDAGPTLTLEERAKRALQAGSMSALLWIFLGGVLLSFTPCVYPVIPITIAYIGGRSGGSRLKGFSLSLVFVLGLGLVYSILGVVAAATGGVFGLSTQNPWVVGFVTLVFLVMGNGMMGAFDLRLPSSLHTALVSKKRPGYWGALFVGGTTGLVAVPCVGPVLVALLSWVATTGKVITGMVYLFVFACGLGLLFVVIGTLTGALTALPKAGIWMEKVKQIFGFVLIATAYYFGRGLIPADWFILAVGFGFLATAGMFGGFSRLPQNAEFGARLTKAMATFLIIAGVFYSCLGLSRLQGLSLSALTGATIPPSLAGGGGRGVLAKKSAGSEAAGLKWIHNDEAAAIALSRSTGKPLMVDFWAEWCVACKELDHKTFSDPQVAQLIGDRFVPLKIDGTKADAAVKAIWARYSVRGLPTVLFLTPNGREIERFEAFRTVDETLPVLKRVVGS